MISFLGMLKKKQFARFMCVRFQYSNVDFSYFVTYLSTKWTRGNRRGEGSSESRLKKTHRSDCNHEFNVFISQAFKFISKTV
jgi:hypothetical protein